MRKYYIGFVGILLLLFAISANALTLQQLIDKAQKGQTVTLKKGAVYKGGIVIKNKSLKLYCNHAVIDAASQKDVITIIHSPHTVIKDCVIKNSGSSGWRMDAAIKVVGSKHVTLMNNKIKNCLYGIVAKNSPYLLIEGNEIASKSFSEGEKGDGIRLWWSSNSRVVDNFIHDSRDVVSIFSNNVVFKGNKAKHSHIGVMIQNSNNNKILDFKGKNNEVNIFLNSSDGTIIKSFSINNNGKYRGVVLVRASDTVVENGKISGCKKALVVNLSPAKAGSRNVFKNIVIENSNIGVYLHTTKEQVKRNIFSNMKYSHNKVNILNEWNK